VKGTKGRKQDVLAGRRFAMVRRGRDGNDEKQTMKDMKKTSLKGDRLKIVLPPPFPVCGSRFTFEKTGNWQPRTVNLFFLHALHALHGEIIL
jgi:hypothetical protein